MRLYSRDDANTVSHGGVTYTAGDDGGFDFPEDVGQHLHAFHSGKRPLWETDIERQDREAFEEAEIRKDPATLLDAVNQLVAAAARTSQPEAPKTRSRAAAKAGE